MTVYFQKIPNIKVTTESHDDALKLGKVSITHRNKTLKLYSVPIKLPQSCIWNREEHAW